MTNRIKVCFFVPFYPLVKGGAEYQSKILAESLPQDRYEVFFISYSKTHIDDVVNEGRIRVYTLNVVPSRKEKLTFYSNFIGRVKKILEREKCDLIYQRVLNSFCLRISMFSIKNGVPYIIHIADNYSVAFGGIKGFIKKQIFQKIVRNKTIFITQTQHQMAIVGNYAAPENIEQISNLHPVMKSKVGKKNRKKILWIGNVRPVKQLEVFIDLANEFEKTDFEFVVVGNIPSTAYGDSLTKGMVKASNLKYLGVQDNTIINELLSSSGLLVNTSISEGFSNTFIQAWMSGTPVLSLNSNPNQLFNTYELGYFCAGDLVKLGEGLRQIVNSKSYQSICDNCLSIANEKFGLEKNAVKFERIIKEHTTHG